MKIVGEYGNAIVNGAGCGGIEAGDDLVFLNAGVSASAAGATQSTFTVYAFEVRRKMTGFVWDRTTIARVGRSAYSLLLLLVALNRICHKRSLLLLLAALTPPVPTSRSLFLFQDSSFDSNPANPTQNLPHPIQVFRDATNTNSIGNVDGVPLRDTPDQLPASTTRRDSHGMAATIDRRYIHVVDRIQNRIEVFDTATLAHTGSYDLTSVDGQAGRSGPAAACLAASVLDDPLLPRNDPAPDLMEITPDGRHLMVALRGPMPVSVSHAAQGSCPGVGVVEITEGGKSGRLVGVLRSTNSVDNVPVGAIAGGVVYAGAERSDIHGAMVVKK